MQHTRLTLNHPELVNWHLSGEHDTRGFVGIMLSVNVESLNILQRLNILDSLSDVEP
jgi:hypothetical protein